MRPLRTIFLLLVATACSFLSIAQVSEDEQAFDKYERYWELADSLFSLNEFANAALYYDSAHNVMITTRGVLVTDLLYDALCANSLANNLEEILEFGELYVRSENPVYSALMLDPDLENARNIPGFISVAEQLRKPGIVYAWDVVQAVNDSDEQYVVFRDKEVNLDFPRLVDSSGDSLIYVDQSNVTISFDNCTLTNPRIMNVRLGGFYFLDSKITGGIHVYSSSIGSLDFKGTEVDGMILSGSSIQEILSWQPFTGNVMMLGCKLGSIDLKLNGRIEVRNCELDLPESVYTDYYEFQLLDTSYTFGKEYLYRHFVDIKATAISVTDSKFDSPNEYQNILFYGDGTDFHINNSIFNMPVEIQSAVSNNFRIENSEFNDYVILDRAVFPEFNTYFPIRQVKKGFGLFVDVPKEANEDDWECFRCALYTNDVGYSVEQSRNFELLLFQYQYLYNNYRLRGELESANTAYVEIKDMVLQKLKYQYETEGGFAHYFRYILARILKVYTNHGTDPGLAMLISLYLILAFAVFYFFFPSEWDKKSKKKLLEDYRLFIQKNDHGYFRPFMSMTGGFLLSLINALTLSLNSFVTLGFGTIPTKGLARYVCIIQGFIGWFLLSIFTVALINQVLA